MRFNQRSSARHPQGGRLQIGIGGRLGTEQVAGFKSESVADFISEWVADLRRNPHLHLADLSGVNTQGTTTAGPSMSDAYPEPLVPGAQYAQVIQQNNAILHNPRIDRTTERLLSILTETVESLGAGSGPIFGIQAHFEFAKRVRALNIPGIREEGVEQSFDLGRIVRYGLDGSVRTDIVLRDRSGIPIAVYDLKTGNAKLTPSRVQELRNAVGRQDIPVIELRYVSESAILR